jgi:dihydroflavonol-4-reductase
MSDLVLLTGISGFVGSHIALQLLNKGFRVRGSVRNLNKSEKTRQTLKNHGADISKLEFAELDLNSDEGWGEAMQDVHYLLHVASPFVTSMPDDKMDLINPAVKGTTRAINAALNANVKRIVLTSSMAAISYGHGKNHAEPFTENDWTNINSPEVNAYEESKTLAEKKAWEIMENAGRRDDLSVINPSVILGPILNDDAGTSGALILRMLNGSIPATPRFYLPIVDVRDVAAMHISVMTDTKTGGQRFIASSKGLWFKEISQVMKTALPQHNKKLPKFSMPDWGVRLYSLFDKDLRGNIGSLGIVNKLNNEKAKALLGRDFITSENAIIAMAKSLIEKKLV